MPGVVYIATAITRHCIIHESRAAAGPKTAADMECFDWLTLVYV